jgi:hypothetical protein
MHILVERILRPVGFDYSGIRIAFDPTRRYKFKENHDGLKESGFS